MDSRVDDARRLLTAIAIITDEDNMLRSTGRRSSGALIVIPARPSVTSQRHDYVNDAPRSWSPCSLLQLVPSGNFACLAGPVKRENSRRLVCRKFVNDGRGRVKETRGVGLLLRSVGKEKSKTPFLTASAEEASLSRSFLSIFQVFFETSSSLKEETRLLRPNSRTICRAKLVDSD